MLLGLQSEREVMGLYLYDGGDSIDSLNWESGRNMAHGLLRKIEEFLRQNNTELSEIKGVFVFRGPGSFTGLRIGLTVMNTLAYARTLPIVGETGGDWRKKAVDRLMSGGDDRVVIPFYDAEARITQPRK